ncbi:MAG: rRNA adenine N-6-methyltransferase family protein [Saprospiraceae bacterium]
MARKIANSLNLENGLNKVLEVGPGTGKLTTFLVENDYDLKVVEADPDMVEYIQHNFPQLNGNIIHRNFLKVDLEVFQENSFALIGNFPYNISSQILLKWWTTAT